MNAPLSFFPLPPFGDPEGLAWEPLREGVEAAWLYRDGADGSSAALLRYQPGAHVPAHEHAGFEHIFILSGSQSDGERVYEAGAFTIFPPGSRHAISSDGGCVALAVWVKPVRFLV